MAKRVGYQYPPSQFKATHHTEPITSESPQYWEDIQTGVKVSPYELIDRLLRRIESLESAIELLTLDVIQLKDTIDEH